MANKREKEPKPKSQIDSALQQVKTTFTSLLEQWRTEKQKPIASPSIITGDSWEPITSIYWEADEKQIQRIIHAYIDRENQKVYLVIDVTALNYEWKPDGSGIMHSQNKKIKNLPLPLHEPDLRTTLTSAYEAVFSWNRADLTKTTPLPHRLT